MIGKIAALLHVERLVADPVQNKRGRVDRRQDVADVDFGIHPGQLDHCRRTRPRALPACKGAAVGLVGSFAARGPAKDFASTPATLDLSNSVA